MFTNSIDVMLDKVFPHSGAIPIVYTDDKKTFSRNLCENR